MRMKHPTALLGKIIPTLLFILLTPLSIIYVPASRTIRKLRECCRLPLWQRSRGTTTDRQERTQLHYAPCLVCLLHKFVPEGHYPHARRHPVSTFQHPTSHRDYHTSLARACRRLDKNGTMTTPRITDTADNGKQTGAESN